MIRRFVAQALSSSFIRQSTLLASGTVLANAITLLVLPLLSRLYSAEGFGLQGLLIMGTMVLGTLTTGFYDWAIPTPKTKKQASELATLALMLSLILSAAWLLLVWAGSDRLLVLLNTPALNGWVWVLPSLALAYGCFYIGNYWLLRVGKMTSLTQIRFVMPGVNAALSLLLGLRGVENGLCIGFIAGVWTAGLCSLLLARRHGLRFNFTLPRHHYQKLARQFREFPLYGSIPASAMILAGQIPLLVIVHAQALDATGHYAVVRSILFTSVYMVATACGQVILKHISEYRNAGEAIWPHYSRMMIMLTIAGVAGAVVAFAASPLFFRLYLGEGWADSIVVAQLMAFAMPLWLLGNALATAPVALKRLKPIAAWQIGYGIAACFLFTLTDLPFMELVQKVVLFEIIAYALYVLISTITVWKHGQ